MIRHYILIALIVIAAAIWIVNQIRERGQDKGDDQSSNSDNS
jgi:hypothetical protein